MVKTTRVLDSVVIGEEVTPGTEASSFDVDVFGDITNCSLSVEDEERVIGGIQGGSTAGHLPSKIVDLKATPAGSITFLPNSFRFYKYVISDFTEGGGIYTLANNSAALPKSLSFKGNYNTTDGVEHLGVYLTNVRFSIIDEDILSVTGDLISLFAQTINEVVTYTPAADNPLIFSEGVLTFDGNTWDLQSFNNVYDPKFIQKWGITTKTATKKRFPSDILRGSKAVISFDGVMNVTDITTELEAIWGGTSTQDRKVDSTLIMTFTDESTKTHVITIIGRVGKSDVLNTDSEENSKTMAFSGVARDFSITGDT